MRDLKKPLVLEHLKTKGSITSLEAFRLYKATRLSGIIYRLRDKYNISTMMMDGEDGGAPYAKYIFKGEKEGVDVNG